MARPRKSLNDPLWLKWDYLRKVHGYETEEWCKKLGISRQTWWRYSTDSSDAKIGTLKIMSSVLHVPLSEVVNSAR